MGISNICVTVKIRYFIQQFLFVVQFLFKGFSIFISWEFNTFLSLENIWFV